MSEAEAAAVVDELEAEMPGTPREVLSKIVTACGGNIEASRQLIAALLQQQQQQQPVVWDGRNGDGQIVSQAVLYGTQPGECGYCGESESGRVSYMMECEKLLASDYQRLLDRGWRRSGTLLYRPDNAVACCPQYTIRLDVNRFKPNRKQRQVRNRFERFVSGKQKPPTPLANHRQQPQQSSQEAEALLAVVGAACGCALPAGVRVVRGKVKNGHAQAAYTCNAAFLLPGTATETAACIADAINSRSDCTWKARVGNRGLLLFDNRLQEEKEDVDDEPQQRPSRARADSLNEEDMKEAHTFTVETVPAAFSQESFEVYKKYQIAVHRDKPEEVTTEGYARFLCTSPLVPACAFHQLYRIDGRLAAVGVIDLLDKCVSSVYLFYDPDFERLSLGTLTALKEIEFTQTKARPYYYLGYYIHSCPKMRYKGDFSPADLLCPVTLSWHPLAECRPLLDEKPYVAFGGGEDEKEDGGKEASVDRQIGVVFEGRFIKASEAPAWLMDQVRAHLEELIRHTGPDVELAVVF